MINFVVALPAEARALVRHYQLQRDPAQGAFPLFRGEQMALVLSGPGKASAAAATTWLAAQDAAGRPAAWLNIGIAGHASHAIGTGATINRITDKASGRSWYPPQVHNPDLPCGSLVSVDLPEQAYLHNALYDMEASGFYPAACSFTTGELVQCFKIVSDNRQQGSEQVTGKLCTQLIAQQLQAIDTLVQSLAHLQHEYRHRHAPHPEHARMIERWHFTVSQQHQLSRLLVRWGALKPGYTPWDDGLERMNSATAVLENLEQRLDV